VSLAQTQGDGPRVYWKGLAGANAVTFWGIRATGNANPFDPAHVVTPNAGFRAELGILGYHKVLPLFGRTATASLLVPVGNVEGEVTGLPTAAGVSTSKQQSALGFGDPQLQLNVNLIGAPTMLGLADFARYEPKFTLDVLGTLAFPIGKYDDDKRLNIGQNRWYGRIGVPMMLTFGPWVPGQRTTLEVLPAGWFFSENDDFGGRTLKNDPLLQLEAHLTRDLTETLWASLDMSWFYGAKPEIHGSGISSTIGSISGKKVDNVGVGLTLGYQVTDNLLIQASYFTTVNNSSRELQADEFRLQFTYAWHPLVEGMKRLQKGH